MRINLKAALICTIAGMLVARSAGAVTFADETKALLFTNSNVIGYSPGFTWSTQAGDMDVDNAGNPHLVHGNSPGHLGVLQYRRFTHATATWSGPVVTFISGDGTYDIQHTHICVDDANRVHITYQFRIGTNAFKLYHLWCTNATGSTPLSATNWDGPTEITTIPVVQQAGSLISVGSNLLLYAVGKTDATGNGYPDIRIDRADWNGSSWDWSPIGVAASNGVGTGYGGYYAPTLTYDRTNDVLHLAYRDEAKNGDRVQAYSQCSDPTNPVYANWGPLIQHGGISAQLNEGNGGTGVLDDGRAVALVYLGANRDNMGSNTQDVTRVREVGAGGSWGPWTTAFTNDYRSYGSTPDLHLGYGGYVAFAPDGADGLFVVPPGGYISHWDPKTAIWSDVYTNFPATFENSPVASARTVVRGLGQTSTLYYFRRGSPAMLYKGTYIIKAPAGTVVMVR